MKTKQPNNAKNDVNDNLSIFWYKDKGIIINNQNIIVIVVLFINDDSILKYSITGSNKSPTAIKYLL